jgi:hypothetical protein
MLMSRWIPILVIAIAFGAALPAAAAHHEVDCAAQCYTAEEECSKACPAEVGVGEACRTTCAESSDSCRKACPGGGDEPTEENPIPESP